MTVNPDATLTASSAPARPALPETPWPPHLARAGDFQWSGDDAPANDLLSEHRARIEPWLSALMQAEHLNLLVGSGFTTAIGDAADAPRLEMNLTQLDLELADAVAASATASATALGRGNANLEDQVRAIHDLLSGLRILVAAGEHSPLHSDSVRLLAVWRGALDDLLGSFLRRVLKTEQAIRRTMVTPGPVANDLRRLLGEFMLAFASRAATRDRLHIFTTNYDRVIEYGCDLLGLRVLDRFVGGLVPVFRSSRLGVDLHYNPPGIRGEPHYLEGVVRFTKLHGSVDWRWERGSSGGLEVSRIALPFGADAEHPAVPGKPGESLLVYPSPAKDVETLEYPYADLFRDFAAAVCQPNTVLFTYGYGFGDDHVNRVLRDMLTVPSTHLVVISHGHARVATFCESIGRDEQITLLLGSHFGHLPTLTRDYLPTPAIDRTTWRMVELLNRRARPRQEQSVAGGGEGESAGGGAS